MALNISLYSNRRPLQQRGVVYIELALTVPIVVLLIMGAIDIGLMLDTSSKSSLLSRESANDAYRLDCFAPSSPLMPDPDTCLSMVRERIFMHARNMGLAKEPLSGPIARDAKFEVILSLYKCQTYNCSGNCLPDTGDSTCTCQCLTPRQLAIIPKPPDRFFPTRHTEISVAAELAEILNRHEKIIISEIVVKRRSLTPLTEGDPLYEESIF